MNLAWRDRRASGRPLRTQRGPPRRDPRQCAVAGAGLLSRGARRCHCRGGALSAQRLDPPRAAWTRGSIARASRAGARGTGASEARVADGAGSALGSSGAAGATMRRAAVLPRSSQAMAARRRRQPGCARRAGGARLLVAATARLPGCHDRCAVWRLGGPRDLGSSRLRARSVDDRRAAPGGAPGFFAALRCSGRRPVVAADVIQHRSGCREAASRLADVQLYSSDCAVHARKGEAELRAELYTVYGTVYLQVCIRRNPGTTRYSRNPASGFSGTFSAPGHATLSAPNRAAPRAARAPISARARAPAPGPALGFRPDIPAARRILHPTPRRAHRPAPLDASRVRPRLHV